MDERMENEYELISIWRSSYFTLWWINYEAFLHSHYTFSF